MGSKHSYNPAALSGCFTSLGLGLGKVYVFLGV